MSSRHCRAALVSDGVGNKKNVNADLVSKDGRVCSMTSAFGFKSHVARHVTDGCFAIAQNLTVDDRTWIC